MKSHFDYGYVPADPLDQLEVENIGNCVISANNDVGEFWYLVIVTKYGITRIYEAGPWGDGYFPLEYKVTFKQQDYDENKIVKVIKSFLNNPTRDITQAMVVDYEDIVDKLVDPLEYLNA